MTHDARLRVALINDERYPSVHTDCQQVVKTADALGAEGCAVDLVVPRMARHLLWSAERRKRAICEHFNVAGTFRLRDLVSWPASDLRLEKLTHGLTAPLRARGYDAIITRNLLPLRVGSRIGQPLIFECYRALPRTDPRSWRVVAQALRRPGFLGVVTHSPYARAAMLEAGADAERVAAIVNGFDPGDFVGLPARRETRDALGVREGDRLAVYAGHVRADKGVLTLLELAEDRPEWRFALVGGTPPDLRWLREQVRARGLENVSLIGRVAVRDVPRYLVAADALLLPFSAAPLTRAGRSTVLPMKVFTYLAAGRPIVAPELPDTAEILIHGRNSLKVPAGERAGAAAALATLAGDAGLAARLGEAAQQDARGYTWRARAQRLIAFIEQRLAARTPR